MTMPKVTLEEIRREWSKTYNSEGKPEWSHIFPYYDEQIVFHDSIQKIEGKADFEAMCTRLTKRCKSLKMDIYDMSQNNQIVMMEWEMTMSFRFFPEKAIYGLSKLTFNN
ncbi:MAG: nuclear transport factor 2 family protein, partial [Culicoidibacterales bacterium]